MANYTKINLDLQSDLVLSKAKIDAVTGGLRSELDAILLSASTEEARALAAEGALDLAAQGYANDAEVAANQHTNNRETAITTAYKVYADQAELDAIDSAKSYTNQLRDGKVADNAAAISGEENARILADNALGVRIDRVLSNVDETALNSLAEIVAEFQKVDGDLEVSINNVLTGHTFDLNTEIANRTKGDSDTLKAAKDYADIAEADAKAEAARLDGILKGQMETYADTAEADAKVYTDLLRDGKVADNAAAIDAEVSRATAAELVLRNNLASEVTNRASEDVATLASAKDYTDALENGTVKANTIAINDEVSRANAAELVLRNDLASEVTRATGVEGEIADKLSGEISRAEAAELVLTKGLADEIARAEGIEAGLQSSIDNLVIDSKSYTNDAVLVEKKRAEDAELALSNKIADIISNVDPSALDSLTEIVAAFQSADGDLEQSIIDALGTHTSELAKEITNRIAGDAATLAAAKVYTDALENGKVKDNTIAINDEVSRATAAEAGLDGKIGTEEAARIQGDSELNNKIGVEASRAIAAELVLTNGLADEVSRATTKEGLLSGEILAEKNRAIAAEGVLTTAVANEVIRAEGIEAGLQTAIDNLVTNSQSYTDNAVTKLKKEVDNSVEKILDLDFKSMFAQKIGGKTDDNVTYRLSKLDLSGDLPVMGTSLQVFENGLLLEEGADYSVIYGSGVNDAEGVKFKYQIKSDWKVKFFGVPFVASDVDLIAG